MDLSMVAHGEQVGRFQRCHHAVKGQLTIGWRLHRHDERKVIGELAANAVPTTIAGR